MSAPIPRDEAERLRDLHRLDILDTPREAAFDRICRIAATVTRAPMAFISLVDRERQWFKSCVGADLSETPREVAFCAWAILEQELVVVPDATKDSRFAANPFVTGEAHVRFYAGAPLRRAEGGSALGTLCVADTQSRSEFALEEQTILTELASIVTELIEQRLVRKEREIARVEKDRREELQRNFHEAIRYAQNLFIAGEEPDIVFGHLLMKIAPLTGSHSACLAKVMADSTNSGRLRVCAAVGEIDLLPFAEEAFRSGRPAVTRDGIALPAKAGDEIVGVIALVGVDINRAADLLIESNPLLISVASLLSAARARRQGRQQARAIALRDRALASIGNAVSILDMSAPGGAIIYCNRAFENMFGYTAPELTGTPFRVVLGAETDKEGIVRVDEAIAKGEAIDTTFQTQRRDGSVFWHRLEISPVRNAAGSVEYLVTVGTDMTDHIRILTELREARAAAEANAQAKSRFLANMSHEIRTPMNAVIGMTGLLLDSSLSDEQRDYVETIRMSGDGLLAIINEILDFSKIDSGALQLEAIEFDLRNCIESALDLVAGSAARKSLDLGYLLDPGVPEIVTGDTARLRQILINLLGNAIKFTEKGSVMLSVSGSRMDCGRWELHFAVEDTGIGIPPEKIEEIFKPFQQADTSSTRRYGGTGLGLAISRHLAELMGGRMWVDSRPGQGSTFHFTTSTQARPNSEKLNALHASLAGRRGLLVDPSANSRAMLEHHLQAWGVQASVFPSMKEVSEAETGPFDFAIIDNDLPESSTEELTKVAGEAPLVLLCTLGRRNTGFAEQLRGRAAQPVRLHSKPIKPSYLCDTLAGLLSEGPVRMPRRPRPSMFDPDFASRLPFRILVVEDNPVNQKLALLLLSRMGYRADTANNGLEAIRALRRQRYDVVFMDMHMPEMDGVEASRQIQDLWKEDERPWIIALTANAMPSDRELCRRAGMHDFLTKPIQGADLQAALLNVPQRPCKGADIPSPYPGEVEWEVPEYLADLAKEDPETCRELIGLFCADGEKSVDALEIALTAGNETAVRRHLHTLKGSSAQMGASAMAALCADMEEKLKGGSLVDAAARMPALKARLAAVRVITSEYLEQLSGRPEPGSMFAF